MVLLLSLLLFCNTLTARQEPLTDKKEQKALVEEFRSLDGREEEAQARQAEILARLSTVPLVKAKDIKSWKKTIAKDAKKNAAKLEGKSGRFHWWEEQRRGFYIVGGKTSKPKGLLIGMHGGGVGSGDATSSASAMTGAASKLGWVAIFPEVLEKTERGWTDSGTEEWVMDLIDAALHTWDIDPNKVYLAGHSMGGYGSWTLGAHHSDRVAALAPSAGAPSPIYNRDDTINMIEKGVVLNLRNVPMVVFQSIDDPRVPPDVNQAAVRDVEKAKEKYGGYEDFTYWEVNGLGHGYPNGGLIKLLEKIADFERQPIQDKMVWQPALKWKRQNSYLYWAEPKVGRTLIVERLPESNTIAFETRADLSTMWVLLDERVVDMEKEVIITVNGKETNRGKPQPDLGTLVLTSVSPDTGRHFVARMPVLADGVQ